jgi:DNA repair exonuclease SbcCD ATPase subunit
MHTWLKNEIDNGLLLEQITPSYIRRHCLIEGKQLNLNTIKKYLSEFVQLDDYEPPKKKPQGKLEKDIAELEAMIYDNQERCESISTERENLEIEQEEIKQRLNEIDEKDEELELEYESIDGEINEYQTKLSELQAQLEKNNISKSDDEIALVWPAAENIEIFTKKDGKKWLVWADVNDTTFELIVGGRKPQAINDFKAYYNKEISK